MVFHEFSLSPPMQYFLFTGRTRNTIFTFHFQLLIGAEAHFSLFILRFSFFI